jgi:SAM-dependent methyltransferase
MSEAATSYDAVPYESLPFVETHPDRLAAVATLHGLRSPAIDRCRVLELGCSHGSNLIPMALALPDSCFVGVDLSRRQVADGQQAARELGLVNVELLPVSILDIGDRFGTFDYVICHGVYSWVPPEVQRKILDICARQLAPDGLAFVSYNTYPGWYVRQMVREMMVYHARQFAAPLEQVRQARAFMDFLGRSVAPDPNSTYPVNVQGAAQALHQKSDSYLLHEYLEEVNEPLYFHQFAARIEAAGLRYVADARPWSAGISALPPGAAQAVEQLAGDPVRREQYLDFLTRRSFRRSILCRAERSPSAMPLPERLAGLRLASPLRPGQAAEEFRAADGRLLTASDPLLKAALPVLGEAWPRTLAWQELWAAVQARPGANAADERALMAGLVQCQQVSGLVEVHVWEPPCRCDVSDRPTASPLARYQAERGARVTNLRHEVVDLNDFNRHLLRLLDGTRDRAGLRAALEERIDRGRLAYWHNGQPLTDPAQLRRLLPTLLEQHLGWMARSCLLVG